MPDPNLGRRRRPVWAAVITALAATLVGLGAGEAAGATGDGVLATQAARAGVVVPLTALLLWAALRASGFRFAALGLSRHGGIGHPSAAAGAGAGAVLLGAALVLGAAVLSGVTNLTVPSAQTWLLAALLVLVVVLPEETVFRGFIQHVLGERYRGLAAVVVQAVLFALSAAIVQMDFGGLVPAFMLGFLLGYLRLRSQGLWNVLGVRAGLVAVSFLAADADLSAGWEIALTAVPALAAVAVAHRLHAGDTISGAMERDPLPRHALTQKGVLYDVGSSYLPGQHSRERWRPDVVAEEMRVIAEDLHCTAVTVFGHELDRLEEAARLALTNGLFVWVQPRLVDGSPEEIVARLEITALFCQTLHTQYPDRIGLNVGCELSVFAKGILPGRDFGRRIRALSVLFPFMPLVNRRLDRMLRQLTDTARPRFSGPLTYGSGSWESVDWSAFDMVGIDYYYDISTRSDYRGGLRALRRWAKPVLVTEFGCCSYQGARDRGGSGADILDWSNLDDRKVKPGYQRDETVQADVIDELLDIYETEDVHGAFVCMFIEGDCRYSPDPDRDQDKASFGIVRPPSLDSGLSPDDGHWELKAAFHTLARRYADRTIRP